jgi:hypothetical protein
MKEPTPTYLLPYTSAAREHGAGFKSLLWTSPSSQAARFEALTRVYDFHGKSILDAGCGRADFLDYLLNRGIVPDHYVGLEAMEEVAQAAERKHHARCTILRADFVREPMRLFAGADAVVFCGSLNTLEKDVFYTTLGRAMDAAVEAVVFNFLSSPHLAHAKYLTWHPVRDVQAFIARRMRAHALLDDYVDGDATIIAKQV